MGLPDRSAGELRSLLPNVVACFETLHSASRPYSALSRRCTKIKLERFICVVVKCYGNLQTSAIPSKWLPGVGSRPGRFHAWVEHWGRGDGLGPAELGRKLLALSGEFSYRPQG